MKVLHSLARVKCPVLNRGKSGATLVSHTQKLATVPKATLCEKFDGAGKADRSEIETIPKRAPLQKAKPRSRFKEKSAKRIATLEAPAGQRLD
jgi:hypothetical protein